MNALMAVDQNVVDAIAAARQRADDALERFVEARREVAELEAMRDLRAAMGADIAKNVKIERLREASSA